MCAPATISVPVALHGGSEPTRACTYGSWSAPAIIESAIPALEATRFPALASVAGGSIPGASQSAGSIGDVVGVAGYEMIDPYADSTWPGVWPPQLRVLRKDGRAEPAPSGTHWYAHPRAATDGDGVLHVMWAEPDLAPPPRRSDVYRDSSRFRTLDGPLFRSVWYAYLRDGTWSQPAQVFRTSSLEWHPHVASQLVIDKAGRLGIAFPAEDSTSSMLVYLSAAPSRTPEWGSRVWRFRGGVGYAAIASNDEGRLAIAVVKAPEPPESGMNFLNVMQSTDTGSTWSPPRRVSRGTEEPAIEPHVFLRETMVDVVWTSQPVGEFTDGVAWRASLNPDGRDVSPGPGLRLAGTTNGSRVAVDACGTVHFVVPQYKPPRGTIAYARYDRNGWTPIEYPFDVPVSQPSIAVVGDTVRLIWSSVDTGAVPRATLMTATLPITAVSGPPP